MGPMWVALKNVVPFILIMRIITIINIAIIIITIIIWGYPK